MMMTINTHHKSVAMIHASTGRRPPEAAFDLNTAQTQWRSWTLVAKAEVGDDRIFTYEVAFGSLLTMHYKVAFAQNDKVSQFQRLQK